MVSEHESGGSDRDALWATRYLHRRCDAYRRGTLSIRALRVSARAMWRHGVDEQTIRVVLAEYGIEAGTVLDRMALKRMAPERQAFTFSGRGATPRAARRRRRMPRKKPMPLVVSPPRQRTIITMSHDGRLL